MEAPLQDVALVVLQTPRIIKRLSVVSTKCHANHRPRNRRGAPSWVRESPQVVPPHTTGRGVGGKFKTIAKLGFGAGSTVWLAGECQVVSGRPLDEMSYGIDNDIHNCSKRWKKNQLPRFVTIKIAALNTDASRELAHSKIIASAKPTHEGLHYLRTPLDDFKLQGPRGMHSCLVFKPMRETLFQFQQRLPRQRIPLPLFKLYILLPSPGCRLPPHRMRLNSHRYVLIASLQNLINRYISQTSRMIISW